MYELDRNGCDAIVLYLGHFRVKLLILSNNLQNSTAALNIMRFSYDKVIRVALYGAVLSVSGSAIMYYLIHSKL